ncbi:hypothetical protein Pmar_PMAR021339, partial [Perkinsus marinus ATCC 50983]
ENGFPLPSLSTTGGRRESLDELTAKIREDCSNVDDKIIDLTCFADQNHTCSICFKDLTDEE